MVQTWNTHVNTRFYGLDGQYNDNKEKISYKSGRTIYYLKNSVSKKKLSVKLRLNDSEAVDGKTEFEWFLFFYENTLKSGTEHVLLTNIVTGSGIKEYILTNDPTWSGQKYKEVTLSFEEV